jgi:hypothetical protein
MACFFGSGWAADSMSEAGYRRAPPAGYQQQWRLDTGNRAVRASRVAQSRDLG